MQMSLTFINSILALIIVSVIAVLTFTEAFAPATTPLESSKSSTVVKGDLLVDGANNKFGKYTWLPHEDGNTYIGPGKETGSVILGKKEGINKTIINGPLYFYQDFDNTDTYKVEKKKFSPNNSELRFTINDDANEALTIFGNSCGAGNCGGEGTEQHKFTATGEAKHKTLTVDGNAKVGGDFEVGTNKTVRSPHRLHVHTGEILYLLPKSGVTIGKEWGGTGDLRVQGDIVMQGTNSWILHTPDDGRKTLYIAPSDGRGGWRWGNQVRVDEDGTVVANKVCINDVCIDRNQLQRIKSAARV